MKKILILAAVALMGCAAWAGEMSLRTPEAEMPARIIAAEGDTLNLLPGAAYCRYLPEGDQQGLYYMVLTLVNSRTEVFPQVQLHMLVADTMAISHEGNKLVKATYLHTETVGADAIDAHLSLKFLQYDEVAGETYAKYDIVCTLFFEKNRPVGTKYRGYVTFISDTTNKTYVPENELKESAIEAVSASNPVVRKVLHNGQVMFEVSTPSGLMYLNALGQQVAQP